MSNDLRERKADKPVGWPTWQAKAEEMERNWIGATETHQQERKRADRLEAALSVLREREMKGWGLIIEARMLLQGVEGSLTAGTIVDGCPSQDEIDAWLARAALGKGKGREER